MIPDAYITERRLRVLREPLWPIPASVVISMTEENLDDLDALRCLMRVASAQAMERRGAA